MALGGGVVLLAFVVALCLCATRAEPQLEAGFYSYSCPAAELIVKEEVEKVLQDDPGVGADLLRMHFHDCFVRGCDGSILLNSTKGNTAEKDAQINADLEGFDVIDTIKEKLEAACKGVVSCADILAFASRDSIVHYGGVPYKVPSGRRDGRVSIAADTSILPSPKLGLSELTKLFISKGLSQNDMITLSGAHTVGIAHCDAFSNRLYNGDPTLDPNYAAYLKTQCPPGSNNTVSMDPKTPRKFDNLYYRVILKNQALFTSDQTLVSTQGTATQVKRLAESYNRFQKKFADAIVKMGAIEVLTGSEGEIRADCKLQHSNRAPHTDAMGDLAAAKHTSDLIKTVREMAFRRGEMLLAIVVALCLSPIGTDAQLSVGFYSYSCPKAEVIVKKELEKALKADAGIGADLLRMHFHDCFVRGCDGSILLDSTKKNTAEKDAIPNQTFEEEAFQVIDKAKKKLEKVCKGTVSCADILAFAARDSVVHYGGTFYPVPAGRRDGKISRSSDTSDLPPPTFNLTQLTKMFVSKGLSQDIMITLSGSHTIGVAHCPTFSNRLYNFSRKASTDPTLNPKYAGQLKKECPPRSNNEVDMDPPSPLTFDTSYYRNLLDNRGLFTSDQTLMSTPATAGRVRQFASNSVLFKQKFAAAMVKMGKIGVLTGKQGEIRSYCRVVN
ncbi:Peroxidase [Musa troglodytarum]|uniref:Peroxidase 1 n=1 Tax=Musa troglodytarum TaxID=320322 RepID=A0A9E7JI11_9LILI|nr:Peroxidase [Musa troglodytarum]